MNRKNFAKEKKKIFFYCVAYGLLCEAVSLFVLGLDTRFAVGIICGILATTINLMLLEKVVDNTITGNKAAITFLLQLGRFLIYGTLGYGCYLISTVSLIAYGVGVMGLVVALVITYCKGGGND